MKVKVYRVDSYKGSPIYYRNFGKHFEYLTVINNELFTAQMTVNPHWVTRFLCFIGWEPMKYSQQHQDAIIKMLNKMACTTIDVILNPKQIKPNEEKTKEAKE